MSRFLICSFALVLLYPAGIDMYLVGLPRIAADLNASEAQLHIAFSVYLAGMAAAMLFAGKVADRSGRKPVAIPGAALFIIASVFCSLAEILKNAKTILWNGPVGVFEFPNFRKGTEIVANAIADSEAFSIAGGGDTLAAIDLFGIADKISYISTGGGAFLEFVEGKVLPAVAMLEERAKK